MTLDARAIVQLVFAALLLPALAAWILSRWLSRAACTAVVAIASGIAGAMVAGAGTGLATAACAAAVAYIASGPGFVPTTLDEVARVVRESPRRWWR